MATQPADRATRYRGRLAVAIGIVPLVAAGCATTYQALGTHTARVLINGNPVAEQPRVTCEQVQWVWFIKSLQEAPGFTAQVRTGDTVAARRVRIAGLGGFTGSSWNAADPAPSTPPGVGAEAVVADGTVVITGTAMGFYDDDPAEIATATFEIRTDC